MGHLKIEQVSLSLFSDARSQTSFCGWWCRWRSPSWLVTLVSAPMWWQLWRGERRWEVMSSIGSCWIMTTTWRRRGACWPSEPETPNDIGDCSEFATAADVCIEALEI